MSVKFFQAASLFLRVSEKIYLTFSHLSLRYAAESEFFAVTLKIFYFFFYRVTVLRGASLMYAGMRAFFAVRIFSDRKKDKHVGLIL